MQNIPFVFAAIQIIDAFSLLEYPNPKYQFIIILFRYASQNSYHITFICNDYTHEFNYNCNIIIII